MTSATLEVDGLAKSYGDRVAVEGLSLRAGAGDVLGLLGPNGAGKTTTIRMLTTLLEPSAGSFAVAGVPHTRAAAIRRLIGVLPESAGYPEAQTGADWLGFHARLCGRSRRDAAALADRLLADVGLADRAGSRIGTYSRGMRQRLGIARALVDDPVLVFLDEPTLGLDPAGQRQVLALVRDIATRRGATVVLCTHTLPDVEEVCSSVLILHRGRVVRAGPVAEVAAAVAGPRTARVRLAPGEGDRAARVLDARPGLTVSATADGVQLLAADGGGALADGLAALLAADVEVRGYEVEGARLSDAFLTLTGGAST